jgi:hypothetical protein
MKAASIRRIAALALACACAGAAGLSAYVLLSDPWADGTVVMNLQLGASAHLTDGSSSWGTSAESALAAWNQAISRVQFTIVRDSTAPRGDGNNVNNVFFSNDIYGRAFGTNVLAVTTNWSRRTTRTEADVIFNQALTWDSYAGALRPGIQDFHRVALHEFGHVLGLDHPDDFGQTQASVMDSHVSNLFTLTSDDIAGAQALYGAAASGGGSTTGGTPTGGGGGGTGDATVSFPPREESLDFRTALEAKYRDSLRRSRSSTAVDNEGDVVWTQEYLRYRVNQCSHAVAIANVLTQIAGNAGPAVCGLTPGGQMLFPPRNESLDFRNQLEAEYRDVLHRSGSSTSVDIEGDIVWTQEYLRYRVNGCGHAVAVQDVLLQIDGFAAPPVCR